MTIEKSQNRIRKDKTYNFQFPMTKTQSMIKIVDGVHPSIELLIIIITNYHNELPNKETQEKKIVCTARACTQFIIVTNSFQNKNRKN